MGWDSRTSFGGDEDTKPKIRLYIGVGASTESCVIPPSDSVTDWLPHDAGKQM